MRMSLAILLLGALVGCGGSNGSPTGSSPTPTPVTYNGTYTSESMSLVGTAADGRREERVVTASTSISHNGSRLQFGDLIFTADTVTIEWPMGSAVLSASNFDGTAQLDTACGITASHFSGWFSGDGNVMNVTLTVTSPTLGCNTFEIRGEMRR